jgi:tetratricopeptide (TPR) repeat protein
VLGLIVDEKSQISMTERLKLVPERSPDATYGTLTEAHYQLGELALARGQAQIALIHLERSAKRSPASAKIHFALSRAYRRLGKNEEAAKQTALYQKLKEEETARASDTSADSPRDN